MSGAGWLEPPELTEDDRRRLLSIARRAIAAHLTRVALEASGERVPGPGGGGAFVTVRGRGGELRGCIGTLEPDDEALDRTVARIAISAATRDGRFPPVSVEELPTIALEISVLTAPRPIDPASVQPGLHGLIVRHEGRSGLLLPQVATEHGWDRETFLGYTCRKAGLPADGWRDPAVVLLAFTALVFGEKSEDP
jgi:AmmeMemoRadiSam system protein A